METRYTIAIAGTTAHTVMCAEALWHDPHFDIVWALTPEPKLVGRKQILTENPVHQWANSHQIPTVLIEKSIDDEVKTAISIKPEIDMLLVVDFGYLVPGWLLKQPRIAPINIHPSDLPKYRGSSPGQFTLLYGEKISAVSVIIMNEKLDEGDLIHQEFFSVLSTWNTPDFYQFAFDLIREKLPKVLLDFATQVTIAKPQPLESPTPIARRFTREDGFIPWKFFSLLLEDPQRTIQPPSNMSPLLTEVHQKIQYWPEVIDHAVHALSPWPGVWTIIPTEKGEKRMKVLSVKQIGNNLLLDQVQIEGSQPTTFSLVEISR